LFRRFIDSERPNDHEEIFNHLYDNIATRGSKFLDNNPIADLRVSAQVSIYPLRQEHLTPAIEAVTVALRRHGLHVEVGPMSTQVVGDMSTLFAGLGEAFGRAATTGHLVMTITVSNACPVPDASP
jgi:uncharacterized protein YqgV (UPF0045/DUF77 family)